MMMGVGFLVMLAIVAVPILLIAGLVLLLIRPMLGQAAAPVATSPAPPPAAPTPAAASSVCSRCGARLQADWAHCPHCGAPAGAGS